MRVYRRTVIPDFASLHPGYACYRTDQAKFGIGGLVSKYGLPGELKPFYGSDPTSAMVFLRLKVI